MKRLIGLCLLFCGTLAFAQNCKEYYFLQNNKTVEMTIANRKGKESGKMVYSVSNVTSKGNTTTGTINSEVFDKNGKSISKATNNIQCLNGVLMMDMKMFIPSAQQEQMGNVSATGSS
ncbi:MAG TPA: hypothetical protein VGC95_06780, partial [Chitinophagaceae bacterium]